MKKIMKKAHQTVRHLTINVNPLDLHL